MSVVAAWIGFAPAIAGAALSGAAGSPHCVAMCGGFAAASGPRWHDTLVWSAGRVSAYAGLGAVAGSVGALVPGPGWLGTALSVLLLAWFALRVAGVAPALLGHLPHRLRAGITGLVGRGWFGRALFGLVNGLLPCGLVYAALAVPVALGSPAGGAAAMAAFGVATTPALALAVAGLRRLTGATPTHRRALGLAVFLLGLGAVAMRADTTTPGSWRVLATDLVCETASPSPR